MLNHNIFLNYPNEVFIETGCLKGASIKRALDASFSQIFSIELSEKYYKFCKNRFKSNKNVELILGDSYIELPNLLKRIRSRVTFWLDGHWSMGDTALGKYSSPLMQELNAIKEHFISDHTIIIDDMRCWSKEKNGDFNTEDILNSLYSINPDYKIKYEDGHGSAKNDILIAYI